MILMQKNKRSKPYHEWRRDRPNEARQPIEKGYGANSCGKWPKDEVRIDQEDSVPAGSCFFMEGRKNGEKAVFYLGIGDRLSLIHI